MVVDSVINALKIRPQAFDGVRVNATAGIFFYTVVYMAMGIIVR